MSGVNSSNSNHSNGSRWTLPEDKIRIVLESLTTNISIAELCRKYNVRPNVFYTWKEKFINGGKMTLSVSKHENINQNLQSENERIKELIGELTIVNDAFKKTLEERRRKEG